MIFTNPLVILALISIPCFSSNAEDRLSIEHSLVPPFMNLNGGSSNWDSDSLKSMNDFVELTPNQEDKNGWLFTKTKLTAKNWAVEFIINVNGDRDKEIGDGMAFWFTEDKYKKGTAFGNDEKFKGLGVFFDTYKNNDKDQILEFPRISAMVGDGRKSYNHWNDGIDTEIASCHEEFANQNNPVRVRVSYNTKVFQVETNYENEDNWNLCFRKKDIELPESGYIGFSAVTGGLSAKHDLKGIMTKITGSKALTPSKNQRGKKSSASSRAKTLLYICFIGGIIGGLCYTWTMLSQQKKSYLYSKVRKSNF